MADILDEGGDVIEDGAGQALTDADVPMGPVFNPMVISVSVRRCLASKTIKRYVIPV